MADQNSDGVMAIVNTPHTALATLHHSPDRAVEVYFDPRTPEGQRKLVQAQLAELPDLASMANIDLMVVDYLSHPASKADDATGEISNFRRTVVYTQDGKAYDAGSVGIDKSIQLFKLMAGNPPWDPPIKCKVEIRKLTPPKQWMILLPDLDALNARALKVQAAQKKK